MAQHHKTIQQQLALQILLADGLVKSVKQLQPSKVDCSEIAKLAAQLAHLLRSTARLVSSFTTAFYDRPLGAIFSNLSLNLERAQTLVRKCKQRSGIFRQVFAIATAADVRRVSNVLESSIADIRWLLSVFVPDDNAGVINPSLPPIASNDPVLAWVWSNIATVQHSTRLKDRVEAANSLGSLAGDSDRNKKMIVEEDGIPPLLKLLKDGASPESQIAAASTLLALATDEETIGSFVRSQAIPAIVQALNDSTSVVVRTNVINLVSKMAEIDSRVQEDFGRENVMRPIVTFLANDIVLDDVTYHFNSSLSFNKRKETATASPEQKLNLKISCARALWSLSKDSLSNSRKITETKALICLAKLIEHSTDETQELQINCLKTVTELASVAESNPELRRQVFKPNLPAARALLDQLLRVVNHEPNPKLVVPAITIIGSLARTFPAKETRILGPLVSKLDHEVTEIANESVITLTKFICPDNFNRVEHSNAILEFDGVPRVIGFLKSSENIKIQVLGVRLLCYLVLNVGGNSRVLEEGGVVSVIENGGRNVVAQCPDMKELVAKAVHHLNVFQGGGRMHRQGCVP
ncbi:hypothetical protein LXL04_030735 [Taraxacum kok-saghyz]